MAKIIVCDVCNARIYDGIFLKYRHSLLGLIKITSRIILKGVTHREYKDTMHKLYLCLNCYDRLKERLFQNPNIVEELQTLLQRDARRRENVQACMRPQPGAVDRAQMASGNRETR